MTLSWWAGTRLVAARAMAEGFAGKGWRIVTGLMLLGGIAAVVIPRLLGSGDTTYTLAVVGPAKPALVAQLAASARAGDFTVEYKALADEGAVARAVRDGKADAGLVGEGASARLYVPTLGVGVFPALVSGAVQANVTVDALIASGLTPTQISALQDLPAPKQVVLGPADDPRRAGVGFGVGLVLYLALILAGSGIATTVATEKSTRISEVLLAVLRPTQLLVGTVLGVGLLALIQISAAAIPVAVSLFASHSSALPSDAAPDVALGVVWFVLGLSVYAFVFAGLAALVDKITEVSSAILPANALLIGSYLIAVTVVVSSPNGWFSVAASMFPMSAPMVMPMRWASGGVPGWQLVVSMLLTAGAAVLLARLASVIYKRGVVRTGQRVSLRDVLRPT